MKSLLLILTLTLNAFASPLKLHPKDPFECTFHFINLSETEVVILDIIRSKENGNSIRFAHIQNGKLSSTLIEGKTKDAFKTTPSRITGTSEKLNFDINFDTVKAGGRIPPVSSWGFDISLKDYPLVKYSGKISFEGKEWIVKNRMGTLSHHYGRRLPPYYYFNTLRSDENDVHVVGAYSVIPHKIFHPIRSGYAIVTYKNRVAIYNLLNSFVSFQRNEDRTSSMSIQPFARGHFEIQMTPGPEEQMREHQLEGVTTTLQFGSTLKLNDWTLPAVIDVRGALD